MKNWYAKGFNECGICYDEYFLEADMDGLKNLPHGWDWDDDGASMYYIGPECRATKNVIGVNERGKE